MAWFSRRSKDEPGADPGRSAAGPPAGGPPAGGHLLELSDDTVTRPVAKPLTEAETTRIAASLDELDRRGVDVDDLTSIGAAYDAACTSRVGTDPDNDAKHVCEVFAIAIGEHLQRHSTLSWAVVSDMFGTDLGLAGSRSETVVVPHNLVSARWMRRERGWIPGVVGHLLRLNARR